MCACVATAAVGKIHQVNDFLRRENLQYEVIRGIHDPPIPLRSAKSMCNDVQVSMERSYTGVPDMFRRSEGVEEASVTRHVCA